MLQSVTDWIIYTILGLKPSSRLTEILNFFVYDSIKILLLLFSVISVIGFLRSYLPASKVKRWIISKKAFGNLFASLLGAVSPFCSCSSIPIFLSFLKAGIPLGVTFSFLITSPIINEYLVVLMVGFFGWKITLLYVISGIMIGVIMGILLGRMRLERFIVEDMLPNNQTQEEEIVFRSIISRVIYGLKESRDIIKRLWAWILIAVAIGAFIHNYVPREMVQAIISKMGVFSVPIAVGLGVPMYGSCASIVPIAVALFKKGLPLGTALAFMMATSALSLPEAIMLRRAMKLKLIAIFFTITTLAIIFTGYLFNFIQQIIK